MGRILIMMAKKSKLKQQKGRTVDRLSEEISKLTRGWGRLLEGLVTPALAEFVRKGGFGKMIQVHPGVKASVDGKNAEYDVLVVCPDTKKLFVGSAKVRAGSRDVDELLSDLQRVHEFLPEFQEYEIFGAIGASAFGEGAEKYALTKGLYVLTPSPNAMRVVAPGLPLVIKGN